MEVVEETQSERAALIGTCNAIAGILLLPAALWLLYSTLMFGIRNDFSFGTGTVNRLTILIIAGASGLCAFVWSFSCLFLRKSESIFNWNIAIFVLLVIHPVIAEIAFQIAIAREVQWFRDPEKYFDGFSSEQYWKLRGLWHEKSNFSNHPLLGWVPAQIQQQPDSHGQALYATTSTRTSNRVVIFGDSFASAIFPALRAVLPNTIEMYGLGVPGYGLDQSYLRYLLERDKFQNACVIFGILTQDLDRSILDLRSSLKPRFEYDHESLILKNVPVPAVQIYTWVQNNPPSINSYYFQLLTRVKDLLVYGLDARRVNHRTEEKKAINRMILKALAEQVKLIDQKFFVILFYPPNEINREEWREQFLKDSLTIESLRFVDSKAVLLNDIAMENTNVSAYYDSTDHHNERGNRIVAEVVRKYISKYCGLEA